MPGWNQRQMESPSSLQGPQKSQESHAWENCLQHGSIMGRFRCTPISKCLEDSVIDWPRKHQIPGWQWQTCAPSAPVSYHSLEPKPKWDAHQMGVLLTNNLIGRKWECRCHQKETNAPLSGFGRRWISMGYSTNLTEGENSSCILKHLCC